MYIYNYIFIILLLNIIILFKKKSYLKIFQFICFFIFLFGWTGKDNKNIKKKID